MTIDDLHQLATSLGVTVTAHTGGVKGWFEHRTKTISIRNDLRAANYRCTLAYEIAHAVAGDTPTGIPHFDQRMERSADMTAASMLIDQDVYQQAEAVHGTHTGALARELGVTTHMLAVWRDTLERIRT